MRSSLRRVPAAALPNSFSTLNSIFSSRHSHTAVRSSSTASASALEAAEAAGEAAQTGASEEEARVVLPTNESSENLLRIRHTVLLLLSVPPSLSLL
jgi:hypothetical protein